MPKVLVDNMESSALAQVDKGTSSGILSNIASTANNLTKDSSEDKKSSPFGEFFLGLVLICCALPMVWMNERKQVKMFKIVQKARESVTEVEIDSVTNENEYKLVHASGRCTTKDQVSDERFSVTKDDTVKIKRIVEVY